MRLSETERTQLSHLVKDYLEDNRVQSMKHFRQHGAVSTLDHCKNVTRLSFYINKRLNLKAEEDSLVLGALLHDFYLYDWHDNEAYHKLHGFKHSEFSRKNASKYFNVNPKVENIIRSHMWPLNLTKIPTCREAWIVCLADKYCSLYESVHMRTKKKPICK